MKELLKKVIPPELRLKIRATPLLEQHQAGQLARHQKRLDVCAAQIAELLLLARHPPLAGKVCVEIGAGWVMSHSLVFHLLGAERVIATDIDAHAHPPALQPAVHHALPSLVRDQLAPFSTHADVRARLNRLMSIRHFDFSVLKQLGIEYVAPIDLARERLRIPFDLAYSNSVLEHVPIADVPTLLDHLVADLRPGGTMLHCIHLEDHRDIDTDPLGFLALPTDSYSSTEQSLRGNRLRKSDWQEIIGRLESCESTFVYEWSRLDRPLPQKLDPIFADKNEADLRASHLGLYMRKRG